MSSATKKPRRLRHNASAGGDRRRATAATRLLPHWRKSDLKVRNAERGLLAVDVTCLGRAAHTAAARVTGVNAIAKRRKQFALEKDIDRFHPAVGKPVISVNTIQAGIAHNVVPGECTFSIDRRLIPGETRESAVAEIVAAHGDIASNAVPLRARRRPTQEPHPANITEESSPIVQALQDIHGDGRALSISSPGPARRTAASTARRDRHRRLRSRRRECPRRQ